MNVRFAYWFPLILMGLLALLSLWLNQLVKDQASSRHSQERHVQDYWMENFQALQFDENGHPLHRLAAQKLTHFPDTDSSDLTEPRLLSHQPQHPALSVQAHHGRVSGRGEEVLFTGNVQARREATPTSDALSLTTESLTVYPNRQLATTREHVTIRTPHATVSAVGMSLNNKSRVMVLQSRVRGQYVPKS